MKQIAMILYKPLHCFCMCLASRVPCLCSCFLTCFSVTPFMLYLVRSQSWLPWSRLSGQKAPLSPIWTEQLIYSSKSNHYCYQTVFWNTERLWAVPQGCSSVEVQNVLLMKASFTKKSWFGRFFSFPISPNILIFFSMNSSLLHLSTYVIALPPGWSTLMKLCGIQPARAPFLSTSTNLPPSCTRFSNWALFSCSMTATAQSRWGGAPNLYSLLIHILLTQSYIIIIIREENE